MYNVIEYISVVSGITHVIAVITICTHHSTVEVITRIYDIQKKCSCNKCLLQAINIWKGKYYLWNQAANNEFNLKVYDSLAFLK